MLKLSFDFKEFSNNEITFMETRTKYEECDPTCVYGVCKDSVCFCQIEYMGIDCSIGKNLWLNLELKHNEKRFTMIQFGIFIILAGILGFITMYFIIYLIIMSLDKNIDEDSKDIAIVENWEVDKK